MELDDDRKDLIDQAELRRLVLKEALLHKTKSAFARDKLDVYPSFLQNFLGGTKGPGFKILDYTGYEEVIMYKRKR